LADKFGFGAVFISLAALGYVATIILIPLHSEAKTLAQIKRERRWSGVRMRRDTIPPVKVDNQATHS
jgi:hypothetical protein